MSSNRPYEDAYDALNQSMAETGRTRKEVASRIYPGRKIETALSLFSRAMSPENTDVNLSQEMVKTVLECTRPIPPLSFHPPVDLIHERQSPGILTGPGERPTDQPPDLFYLCDKFGFERPARKPTALETEIRMNLQVMHRQMAEMMKKLEKLEGRSGR
jgi:hypothetical protein